MARRTKRDAIKNHGGKVSKKQLSTLPSDDEMRKFDKLTQGKERFGDDEDWMEAKVVGSGPKLFTIDKAK